MNKCPMCGREFDKDEAEKYLSEKFGYDAVHKIWGDLREKWNVDEICDSCWLSVYYEEHPTEG